MTPLDWIQAMNNALTYCQNNKDELLGMNKHCCRFLHGGTLSHEAIKKCNENAAVFINGGE